MAIVIVVGIIVIWIGACLWRRHYLKKKERQKGLGKLPAHDSWGPGAAPPDHHGAPAPGLFLPPGTHRTSNRGSTHGSQTTTEKTTPPPPAASRSRSPKLRKWVSRDKV